MVTRAPKPPPLGRVRFAKVDDASLVLDLISEAVSQTFRVECTNDIMYLIENAILCICQLDKYDNIIGFLAARDYPIMPSVHPSSWENYVWNKYKAIELNSQNTLFLHLLCWDPVYTREAVDNMLKSIFMQESYVQHIAMVKSVSKYPLLVPGQSRSEASFRRVAAVERGCNVELLPALYIADRTEVNPRLRIRRAVEEDNDDIVPIIENHSYRLGQLYGEFYISELISRHPESDRVLLVCEHNELAVGVMCLNTTVNYEALEESFVLAPFGGLRHLDTEPEHAGIDEQDISAISLLAMPHYTDSTSNDNSNGQRGNETSPNFLITSTQSEIPEEIVAMLIEDEDSELDFDIVNISREHLRVPELLYSGLSLDPIADEKIIEELKKGRLEAINELNKKKRASKINTSSNMTKQQEPVVIRYHGTPNAFLIEIFAIHNDYDERYGFDILEAAYELFPDRDYCVICLPSSQPPFPLLEHFTLVTPIGDRVRFINESLYVAHVNSVRGKLRVREGEKHDMTALEDVLQNSQHLGSILNLYESSLHSNTLVSFVFLSENQPIGVVVVGPLEDGTTVRTNYDLDPEPGKAGSDGAILVAVISPAFEPHTRWYMREVIRQSQYVTLFWTSRLFAKGDASPVRSLISVASHMTPVHPRVPMPNITENKDLDKIFKKIASPFALWMLDRPLTSLPKVYLNNNIVVVGASRTGLSFLEALIMGPASQYLTFTNLTLVSQHGLSTMADCLKAADICVPRDGRFTDRYIKSIPFYFYVDVVTATMAGIDRKKKCIYLKNGTTKFYDELVLTCGEQFQHPEYLKDELELVKEVQKGKPCDRLLMDNPKYQEDRVPPPPELPDNVFLVNSLYEANVILRKLLHMITDTKREGYALSVDNPVIVYGDSIQAYTCIAALLELGIQSKFIVFVEPFPSMADPKALRVNCFNDETVDERVQVKLEDLGIRVFRECFLDSWKLIKNVVESLNLMTPLHAISLDCFALFYYGLQAIDLHAFKAINECGLVYDGGLVVSPTFETNDPFIYGAGTCVSYSRKLYATRALHRNYCSEDIGEALARLFLRRLDPFSSGADGSEVTTVIPCTSSFLLADCRSHSSIGGRSFMRIRDSLSMYRRWQPVMKFNSPIAQFAILPGPLYYMKVRKPGNEIPMAVQQILPHQGHTLTTDVDGNYFSLKLNVLHTVNFVTCLSKKPFSFDILSQLYGKHESFFNKLLTRYMKNEITDLYEFFTQPWMSALYQETFKELINEINEQDVGMIYNLVKSKFALYDEEDPIRVSMYKSITDALYRPARESIYRPGSTSVSTVSLRDVSLKENLQTGTFRSVIENHVVGSNFLKKTCAPVDISWECGQNQCLQKETLKFWDQVTGERIISTHLRNYLDRNSVTNPHYAKPNPE